MSLDSRGRSFQAYAALGPKSDSRIRPGMNGTLDIITERIPTATIIPSEALFTRNGKPTVHVMTADGFRPTEVEVLARNPDEIAVKGVPAEARVALADPFEAGVHQRSGNTSRDAR